MSNKNIVLVFSASWCNPCKVSKKYLETNHEPSKYHIIDLAEDKHEEEALYYKVRNLPTFILLDVEGKEIRRFTGFDKEKIDNILSEVV